MCCPVTCMQYDGYTALHRAVGMDYVFGIQSLLYKNADVEIEDDVRDWGEGLRTRCMQLVGW